MHDQILRPVIFPATEIALQNGLRASGIAFLRVNGCSAHVWHHGVSAAKGVLGVAEGVVLGCRLGEPDVAAVAAEVSGFEGFGDVFFYDDCAAGGVD